MREASVSPPTSVEFALPPAIANMLATVGPVRDDPSRMDLVVRMAAANAEAGGGPFAAALFWPDGTLVAAGVNLVLASCVPVAHAEIVAIALAGRRLGTFDLASGGPIELVTSCEPCAMCLGALPWAGVSRVVAGARDEDARAIGFDEGDKPPDWGAALEARGVSVVRDLLRAEAAAVIRSYAEQGGVVYNGSVGGG